MIFKKFSFTECEQYLKLLQRIDDVFNHFLNFVLLIGFSIDVVVFVDYFNKFCFFLSFEMEKIL